MFVRDVSLTWHGSSAVPIVLPFFKIVPVGTVPPRHWGLVLTAIIDLQAVSLKFEEYYFQLSENWASVLDKMIDFWKVFQSIVDGR